MKQLHTKIVIIMAVLAFCAGTITAQTGSRLIAHTYYITNADTLIAYDSDRYIYPNVNTTLDSEMLSFMTNGTAMLLTRKTDYTRNTTGNLTFVDFQNWNAASGAYINGGLTYYTLNAAGFCIEDSNRLWIPANSAYRDNVRDIYTVDASGNITDQIYDDWDGGGNALIHTFRYVNTYNTLGKQLTHLQQDWDASIQWYDNTKSTYAYDATDTNIQTITGEQAVTTPGVLQLTYQDVYTYNTDGTVATVILNDWNSTTSTYTPGIRSTFAYDTAGNNILQTQEEWTVATSAYRPYQQYVTTFNSHNQMTSQTRVMWNTVTLAYDIDNSKDIWYYEDYTDTTGAGTDTTGTTGVKNIVADAHLSVSPIPTAGQLHIALTWAQPQAFTATITDMSGRLCNTFSATATKEYRGNVNLGNLPAGNYALSIRGEQGATLSRMIVVAR